MSKHAGFVEFKHLWLIGLFAGSGALFGFFQDDIDDFMKMDLEQLLQIEVTSASKFAQKTREAPSVISAFTAEQTVAYGWNSINDILYKQPGFGPGQDFDRPTVPSRGLFDSWSNNHILHLVDGVPMNDNFYGTAYTWEITPIFMARSIEVIRGPGSALYGSNATNGVVQVNTVSAADMDKRVDLRVRSGSLGTQAVDAMVGHDSEHFSSVISFSTYTTDGNEYQTLDGSGRFDSNGQPAIFETMDQRESSYLWAKVEGKGNLKGLTLQYHRQDWDFQTGHGWLWWVPDFDEDMNEQRNIFALKYQRDSGKWSQEYVLRHQRHDITWNMRYYPTGAFEDFYPSGMWEFLDTQGEDLFFRAQAGYQLPKDSYLLFGFEGDQFSYDGDNEHFSNINVDSAGFEPFPGDINTPLGPFLDFITGEDLLNSAFYGQYSSGGALGEKLQMTLGVRFDKLEFDYNQIYTPGRPKAEKSFSRVSPRLAFVFSPTEKSTYRLMGGKAFRAPAPTEMAGAHTFALASNIEELQPELITTFEVTGDWILGEHMNLKANLFRTEFENQIAFSTANNNLSTNVFSQTNQGLELELIFQAGDFSGFVNLSLTDRVDEEVLDATIGLDQDNITWEPSEKLNFGMRYNYGGWLASLSGHYHGETLRRSSDVGIQDLPLGVGVALDMDAWRDRKLDAWFTVDSNIAYRVNASLSLGLTARNLFDSDDNQLVKTGPFPFDYQGNPRRVDLFLRLSF